MCNEKCSAKKSYAMNKQCSVIAVYPLIKKKSWLQRFSKYETGFSHNRNMYVHNYHYIYYLF